LTRAILREKRVFLFKKASKFGFCKPFSIFVANRFNMYRYLQAIFYILEKFFDKSENSDKNDMVKMHSTFKSNFYV